MQRAREVIQYILGVISLIFITCTVWWGGHCSNHLHFWCSLWRRKVIIKHIRHMKASIRAVKWYFFWRRQSHTALLSLLSLPSEPNLPHIVDKGGRFICSHYHFHPHHCPSHHISIHTITPCVWVCISSFHLLNTHGYTVILAISNFCFLGLCMLQLPLHGKRKQVNISLYHYPHQPLSFN